MTRLFKFVFMLAGISVSSLILADQIQPLLDVGQSRQAAEKTSQSKIDEMEEQTSVIVSEFKTVSKQIEGLRVYNAQMRQQIQRQEERLKEIDKTMKEAQVMQRQIPPFTRRMLAGVETSIELDLPFHLSERKERIAFAKAALDNPTVSPAEGLRQVLEAFLEKGMFVTGAAVEQDFRASLPHKLLMTGFSFLIIVAVSAYVANLAAFLTFSNSVSSFIASGKIISAPASSYALILSNVLSKPSTLFASVLATIKKLLSFLALTDSFIFFTISSLETSSLLSK